MRKYRTSDRHGKLSGQKTERKVSGHSRSVLSPAQAAKLITSRAVRLWFYPLQAMRRRPGSFLGAAVVMICLLSMVTMSLILSESSYLGSLADAKTGYHTGVLYRLDPTQMTKLKELAPELEISYTVIPVYGVMEDIVTEEAVLSLTVWTDSLAAQYGLTVGEAPGNGSILLPGHMLEKETYYRTGQQNSFFFHGQDGVGEKTGISITRRLRLTEMTGPNDENIPYAVVSERTARDILSAASGQITYDVYFTTARPSDYAAALVIDTLLEALDWQNPDQQIVPSLNRRDKYGSFINYDYLDLIGREYMDDPVFFFLILPTLLAAALGTAGILWDDTESHLKEYGLLKASGAGEKTLLGIQYVTVGMYTLIVLLPTLAGAVGISSLSIRRTNAMLEAGGIPYRFGLPVGNLITVCVYFLLFTCLILYLRARQLFARHPSALLRRSPVSDAPEVRQTAMKLFHVQDPAGYMTKVTFRRESRKRIGNAFTSSLLTADCGYLLYTMYTGPAGNELNGLFTLLLYGTLVLLTFFTVYREIRLQKREYAILRQCGTLDSTIWRRVRQIRLWDTLLGTLVTFGIFAFLFFLPLFLSSWVFRGLPMVEYLLSARFRTGLIVSCGIAMALQLGNLAIAQLAVTPPVRTMLRSGIMDDLRNTE